MTWKVGDSVVLKGLKSPEMVVIRVFDPKTGYEGQIMVAWFDSMNVMRDWIGPQELFEAAP